ncbi:hypothetical protein HZ326_28994 [Fusarium oxysporum f. sp. albedinis]|nr:hypothetical protein HZ326_28994 [Fusarium oxysporum f. sp. albedinis]
MASATFLAIHRRLLRLMMHKVSDEPGNPPGPCRFGLHCSGIATPQGRGLHSDCPESSTHALAGHLFPILDR